MRRKYYRINVWSETETPSIQPFAKCDGGKIFEDAKDDAIKTLENQKRESLAEINECMYTLQTISRNKELVRDMEEPK